ncbi:ClpXP protease specificity-enhancing factor [Chitinilyticum piscinae]|uniref:ClpXP protease specificity-enhancing factor n=1 Tax=Chitinilyticum piscinae TaxID=2866724 RepID=A0A8J7FJY9_9NEIS|nr:ClpXP protease specificity-enhancing factor [Chitinilyticum piscinae]MBE9610548.1 ClpXP protease specificity-enhancing factor [Chitinilyticum piscinae]
MQQTTVSTKPYLIRAIHEWCSDQGFTPYLVVAVRQKMQVPQEFVKNGEIVLNISYNATRNLTIGNDYINFSARFNGVSRDINIPVGAVVSIFSRENGEGMGFEYEGTPEAHLDDAPASTSDSEEPPPRPSGRPQLRIVK